MPEIQTSVTAKRSHSASIKAVEPAPINWKLKGVFDWVDIESLDVPIDQYQRDRAASKRASEIALTWNWAAVGTLIVIMRKDKTYKVADGGTRLAAAKKRKEILPQKHLRLYVAPRVYGQRDSLGGIRSMRRLLLVSRPSI